MEEFPPVWVMWFRCPECGVYIELPEESRLCPVCGSLDIYIVRDVGEVLERVINGRVDD